MRINYRPLLLATILVISCKPSPEVPKEKSPISYVNPFIGTGGHGHTYPGATRPFGMVQLSPDTRLDGWDGCSGYHYTDEYIYGFSHTHLSGTGVSDYGDVLLMPTSVIIFNNGADGEQGYRSRFSHDNETASPGYYKVFLEDNKINVELTTSVRSGRHKYVFEKEAPQVVVLDLEHRDEVLDSKVDLKSKRQISGYRHSNAWAQDQRLFFDISFSKPYTTVKFLADKNEGKKVKAAFGFDPSAGETLEVSIGISSVDAEGAEQNRIKEIGDKSFDQLKSEAQEDWASQLGKITVESSDEDFKTNFYTSIYHTMLAPNIYSDLDGRYRGMDLQVHTAKNYDYYTVFSLWDTYRALHPLFTIIEEKRTNDFIKTFLAKYDEGGIMPIWDLSANYTGCMIGYHAVPVIADAYLKGIRDYDTEKAFQAMIHSANQDKLGLETYKLQGFIPVEKEAESVSKTLEYSYDDWSIAQMAGELGKDDQYQKFITRAQYYKNVYDPQNKFMRGRFRNTWFSPFDPYEVNFNYTEANAWQYSFYVPHDVQGLITLLGGKKQLEGQLDKLFSASTKTTGRDQSDISGLIGQYAHGNEPSHHMAYLYNFVNKPSKTQEKIHQIIQKLYANSPDGIPGNEDCGQMSAWFVFSSLGFYPVTPASNQYIIGKPNVKKATINLENGKTFTIIADSLSDRNIYIKELYLNGVKYPYSFLNHSDIAKGGILRFKMTEKPTRWGTEDADIPKSEIKEHLIVPVPFISSGSVAFQGNTEVSLENVDKNATIFYSLDDGDFFRYKAPFVISENKTLHTYATKGKEKSPMISTPFIKIDPNLKIELKTKYAGQYSGGGDNALIDGILGSKDFRTGTWQGYNDEDLIAIIDLGSQIEIKELNMNFLQDHDSWIFLPTDVEYQSSVDGKDFKSIFKEKIVDSTSVDSPTIKNVGVVFDKRKSRFIKVVAKRLKTLPSWHRAYKFDGKPWVFADEIQIK